MMFGADARRTRSQREEAQVRQLLTAGALVARDQLDQAKQSPTTKPTELTLPPELMGKLAITLTPDNADKDHVTAVIHAEHGQRKMEQTVRFERHHGNWRATSASLGEDQAPGESRTPATNGSAGASPSR
jgi:hypothetical protein